ncbi:SHOCT domain-containing protein [Roseiarcaceae bacterium H3SJ34-1]|uniref:SHOCT domain-containing protein n=1 Tax=Terripilifer ovatus TaxID=3032367 RepID=UPI003AB9B313|nr:SHOCT domain-containing protein [Roseiarcaceae bacterium H3SJ34-1]
MGYGYGPQWGMMGNWGYGYGYGAFHMIFWIAALIAIVALVFWLMRSAGAHNGLQLPPRRSTGLDVLEERYARGEINRDEYLQKKKDIAG